MSVSRRKFLIAGIAAAVVAVGGSLLYYYTIPTARRFGGKKVTVVDHLGRTVTLGKPVERIIVTEDKIGEMIRILELEDKVVGIDPHMAKMGDFFPVMRDKTPVGNCMRPLNFEKIAELKPDLVIIHAHYGGSAENIEPLERMKIPVVALDTFLGSAAKQGEPIDFTQIDLNNDPQADALRKLGKIFDREDRAEEFIAWRNKIANDVIERIKDIKEDAKKTAWATFYFGSFDMLSIGNGRKEDAALDMAGLHNIIEEYTMRKVDPEWVLKKDPDVIVITGYADWTGEYTVTDPMQLKKLIDQFSQLPGFEKLSAVKNNMVCVLAGICMDVRFWIGAAYLGKFAYPERFKDISPTDIQREYFEKWLRIPYKGCYFYPIL